MAFSWGAAAGGALDLAGRIYDARMNTKQMHETMDYNTRAVDADRAFQEKNAIADREMQREFAQNGVRWRVEDAVAAGLHPLVGAGAQPLNYSPISVGGGGGGGSLPHFQSTMGQDISRAIMAAVTPEETIKEQLQLKLLSAQVDKDLAMKSYYDALAFRALNPVSQNVPAVGAVQVVPDQQPSRSAKDTSLSAADTPAWKEAEIFPGVKLDFPYSPSEGPWEGLDGFWNSVMFGVRNFLYNPAKSTSNWVDRELEKAKQKTRGQTYRQDYLYSAPTH